MICGFVIHLMIAGRLHGRAPGVSFRTQQPAAFDFCEGSLLLTVSGTKPPRSCPFAAASRRCAPWIRGIEILSSTLDEFRAALTAESNVARADRPRIVSGSGGGGNAYSTKFSRAHFRRSRSPRTCDTRNGSGYIAPRTTPRNGIRPVHRPSMDFPKHSPRFRPDMAVTVGSATFPRCCDTIHESARRPRDELLRSCHTGMKFWRKPRALASLGSGFGPDDGRTRALKKP